MQGWNLTDPSSSGLIAAEFQRLNEEGHRHIADGLLNSLMISVRTIVVGIALSYSPEHCEGSEDTYCTAPEQHYPWSLLRALADVLESIDAGDSFDAFRESWWRDLDQMGLREELENFPQDFTPEEFLNDGEASAESE